MKRVGNLYEIMKSKGTAVMAILEGTRNKHHLKEVRKRFLSEDLHSVDHEKIEKEAEGKLIDNIDFIFTPINYYDNNKSLWNIIIIL